MKKTPDLNELMEQLKVAKRVIQQQENVLKTLSRQQSQHKRAISDLKTQVAFLVQKFNRR